MTEPGHPSRKRDSVQRMNTSKMMKNNDSTGLQRRQGHKRTPSIPLRVRSTSLVGSSSIVATTLLSPSNTDLPPAEPFRAPPSTSLSSTTGSSGASHKEIHAALPQKASEKYGFVVYVGSLIAWYLFLFWSFTPDRYIKALGIEWYPNRCVSF